MTGLEAVELQRASDPRSDEGIRARVAESAQRGMRAGEIANMLGRPLVEILDIGAGLASAGLLEGTAFASDLMSAFQSGIMGNTQAGEFYAGLATNIKDLSDDMYYNEGQYLPRLTAGLDTGPTEAELIEQRRKAIESESLRNMSDAMIANDPSLFAEGSVTEQLPDIPESIIQARKGPGPEAEFNVDDARPTTGVDFGTPPDINRPGVDLALSRQAPTLSLSDMDFSTDVPMTPAELAAANLRLREEGPLTVGGMTEDGLTPAEEFSEERLDQSEAERAAAQEAALAETLYPGKARDFRAEEARIAKMTGMPEIGSADPKKMQEALNSLLDQVVENPNQVSNKIAADLTKENGDASRTSDKPRGDTPSVETTDGEPKKTTDGVTPPVEKVIKMTPAEATDEYYKQLKKRLGLSDEDKARDLSLTMAQFGFAMAAGQSPNALTNIANAANATLAEFRAGQKEERALDRELQLLADERARADQTKREDARDRLRRAYISAGLDPVYGEDGSITSFKALPSKAGTYTPERLRQSMLEMIKDEDTAELFGVLGDDDKIDMDKVNRLIETYQVLGTSLYEGPSTSGTGTSVGTTKTFKQGTFRKTKEGPDNDPNTWEKVG
jgi:hypothetical protein